MKENLNNCTLDKEFHLVSFAASAQSELMMFTLILLMYSLTMLGNVIIVSLVCLISHLRTPMYFFLCNLSIQDILYVSNTLPNFLAITISGDHAVAFPACICQMFIFSFCIGTEFLLLTSMAYDRYVAICIPLRYATIMKNVTCVLLAAASWLLGFLNALTQSLMLYFSAFCKSHNVDHFYCDLKVLINLATSDTTDIKNVLSFITVVMGFLPLFCILVSYVGIIRTIAKTRGSGVKAFSSCSSHLTVVVLFYGPSLGSYTIPQSQHSQEQDKMLSLLYIALVPLLNPLVYTLRNKDILRAMKDMKENILSPRS